MKKKLTLTVDEQVIIDAKKKALDDRKELSEVTEKLYQAYVRGEVKL